MIRNFYSKLKSNQGESLGEVLVAVLIVALGSLLFASMVTASIRIVDKGKAAYGKNMNLKNQIESFVTGNTSAAGGSGSSGSATSSDVSQGTGTITVNGKVTGSDTTSTSSEVTSGNDVSQTIQVTNKQINVSTVSSGTGSDKEIYRYTYSK